MANIDAAFGLRPYKMLGAGTNSNGVMTFDIQTTGTAGTSSTIYEGTPVIPLANGLLDIVGAAAGGTVPLLGAFIGCKYTDLNGDCLLYTSPSPRDLSTSRMPSSA